MVGDGLDPEGRAWRHGTRTGDQGANGPGGGTSSAPELDVLEAPILVDRAGVHEARGPVQRENSVLRRLAVVGGERDEADALRPDPRPVADVPVKNLVSLAHMYHYGEDRKTSYRRWAEP